jgi:hypothetical protein
MVIRPTEEEVAALAPDTSSLQAGRGLAQPAKWSAMGASDRAWWGECQGSGKEPYRTCVEPAAPAYKCSCPSRKFPCKHSLGLMLLIAGGKADFPANAPPPWVEEWLASREKRDQKKQERQEKKTEAEADPEAKEKRERQRKERMSGGLRDLNQWLADILRGGLSELERKAPEFWEQATSRLVDAQAPGLAAWIEGMRRQVAARESGWPERVLQLMGRIKLAIEGFARFDNLPEATQADLRAILGWPLDKGDFLGRSPEVADTWEVLASTIADKETLREQRIYLSGRETRRQALILNFAYGNQPLDAGFTPGTAFRGAVVFYPGGYPLRALLKERSAETSGMVLPPGFPDFHSALAAYGEAVAGNPFHIRFPMTVANLRPHRMGERLYLRDAAGCDLPVAKAFARDWQLVSQSGGLPLTLFGEWAEGAFLPLACWDGRYRPFQGGGRE